MEIESSGTGIGSYEEEYSLIINGEIIIIATQYGIALLYGGQQCEINNNITISSDTGIMLVGLRNYSFRIAPTAVININAITSGLYMDGCLQSQTVMPDSLRFAIAGKINITTTGSNDCGMSLVNNSSTASSSDAYGGTPIIESTGIVEISSTTTSFTASGNKVNDSDLAIIIDGELIATNVDAPIMFYDSVKGSGTIIFGDQRIELNDPV